MQFDLRHDAVMTTTLSDNPHALPRGATLHEYVIDQVLGVGGFGITYLADDTHLHMRVAIKEYLPAALAVRLGDSTVHPKSVADEETYRWGLDRFIREAQTLARFRHPNIVRVLRFFEANSTAYMVMEYEEGQSLAACLTAPSGGLDERFLLSLILPLLDGLKHVHQEGFLHRDIKPANIFIRKDGSPVLLDFGSARLAVSSHTQHLTTVLTPGYAPFEQYFNDGRQGPWTDIYALGAILYQAVTGAKPVDAARRIKEDILIPALTAGKGRFSPRFLLAVDQALLMREEQRPQTVTAWRAMLTSGSPASSPVEAAPSVDLPTVKQTEMRGDAKPVAQSTIRARHAPPKKPGKRGFVVAFAVFAMVLAGGAVWRMKHKAPVELAAVPTPSNESATADSSDAGQMDVKRTAKRFARADTNGDGYLSRDEAKTEFPRIALHFERFDSNEDGRLSLPEVINALANKQKVLEERRLQSEAIRR